MAKYRKVDPKIWNDAKFMALSNNGKLAFLFLLTHPHMTMLGAMRASVPGLAAEIGWPEKAFREAFGEAFAKAMVKADEKASFIWLPNFIKYNRPESPNVVKSWAEALSLLPECNLKDELIQYVKAFMEGLPEAFREALPKDFAKTYPKTMPNQEQEQEQELNTCTHLNGSCQCFLDLPCVGKKKSFQVTEEYVLEMQELYPSVDIRKEIRAAKGWLINNPRKQKTADGIPRFLNTWFSKEQNSGNGAPRHPPTEPPPAPVKIFKLPKELQESEEAK